MDGLKHLCGFDAHHVLVAVGRHVLEACAFGGTGVPHHRLAPRRALLNLQSALRILQLQRAGCGLVNTVKFTVKTQQIIRRAVFIADRISFGLALQTGELCVGNVLHRKVGVQGAGEQQGACVGVVHL